MTPTGVNRFDILRIYWDDQKQPAVECPVGDFFACGWRTLCADLVAGGLRESRQRVQLLLADAVSKSAAGSRWKTSRAKR